ECDAVRSKLLLILVASTTALPGQLHSTKTDRQQPTCPSGLPNGTAEVTARESQAPPTSRGRGIVVVSTILVAELSRTCRPNHAHPCGWLERIPSILPAAPISRPVHCCQP